MSIFKNIFYYLAILLVIFFFLMPIYWMIASSLRPEVDIFSSSPLALTNLTIKNYIDALVQYKVLKGLVNTVIISISNVVITMIVAIATAYSFERFKVRGSNVIKIGILLLRMIPPIAMALPLFLVFKKVLTIDPRLQLVLAFMIFNLPIAVWLMQSFITNVPKELEESAMIDGCTRLGALIKIILPLMVPGLLVTSILVFLYSWNEFLYAVILSTEASKPVSVVMAGFIAASGRIYYGPMFASGTLVILPTIIFGILVRKHFIKGLSLGALKG
jgi:multiple sugar transport system permease protein